jgi:hypothetical protein
MKEFEKSIKRKMTPEKFVDIRDKKYSDDENFYGLTYGLTYGDVSSWLTWNRENGEIAKVLPLPEEFGRGDYWDGPIDKWDEEKPQDISSKLTTDIIFLGLNMSGNGMMPDGSPSFQNARGVKRIVETFSNTVAEGGYFTDIIKPDKRFLEMVKNPADSREFIRIVKAQPDVLKEHIRLFIEELDFIGADKPLLIVFGGDAEWALLQETDDNFRKERFLDIVKIWHYAWQYTSDEKYINDTRSKLARYITIP